MRSQRYKRARTRKASGAFTRYATFLRSESNKLKQMLNIVTDLIDSASEYLEMRDPSVPEATKVLRAAHKAEDAIDDTLNAFQDIIRLTR